MSQAPVPAASDSLLLRIEKPIYGGAGLARQDGKAIFVPYTLPGELVTASVMHSKASFAEAFPQRVIEPSPQRTEPPCPYFGVCGGCHYQHAGYPAQLEMKRAILVETLTRSHLTGLPEIAVHPSQPFGYRNRIRLHVDPAASTLAYRQRGSHRLVAVNRCPVAAPILEQALAALNQILLKRKQGSWFSQVELSINHDASQMLMALWTDGPAAPQTPEGNLAGLCQALQTEVSALAGAALFASGTEETGLAGGVNPRSKKSGSSVNHRRQRGPDGRRNPEESETDNSSGGAPLASWGAPRMLYQVAGIDYWVSLGAFFQVNRTLVDQLAALGTAGREGRLAWDLYAGVGLFSRLLADRFAKVVAVEGAPVSYEDLRANLAAPHQAVRSSTLDFLRRRAGPYPTGRPAPDKPDFVLVDPPRAGLGEEATRLLAQIGPPGITYVSCDPTTLSRDLRVLVDLGYKLQQMHLVDLFPQTFHLETMAMLERP